MALVSTTQVPFFNLDDKHWDKNRLLVTNLRQLADDIEKDDPKVIAIGIKTNVDKMICLCVDTIKRT